MSDKEVVVNGLSEDQAWQELKFPELLNSDAVREIHATIEKEWDFLQRSACQTAAGRALWKHAIHDPLADVLAGETYLRNLHEKIKKDILNNARETSGVILAVRTLWFDSRLEDALNSIDGRQAQVVLLGADNYFAMQIPKDPYKEKRKEGRESRKRVKNELSMPKRIILSRVNSIHS
ncbi:hypothetical protein GmHk_04G009358 [Glycine max]|nr:hypothetical protein GmHk_04G009358 [Glycine max]